jgi:hypothetical protein
MQSPGGLRHRHALALAAVTDFAERLVVDHQESSGCCRPRQGRRWRECPGPGVATGPWCGRWNLVTGCRQDGRLTQSKQQVVRLRDLVTVSARLRPFRQPTQALAELSDLVTLGPDANTRDGAIAMPGPGRRLRGRGNNPGCPAPRASGLGWPLCQRFCKQGPSSNVDAGGYADRDEITSGNTCIYGALRGPWRPPLRGPIIRPTPSSGVAAAMSSQSLPSAYRSILSKAPARIGKPHSRRWF